MLLPVFLLWHSASEMVVQVFLVPLQTEEPASLLARFVAGVVHSAGRHRSRAWWTASITPLDTVSLVLTVLLEARWWIPVGATWFVFLYDR